MSYKVLLINPKAKEREAEIRELSKRGLNLVGAGCYREAEGLLAADGTLRGPHRVETPPGPPGQRRPWRGRSSSRSCKACGGS